LALAPARAGGTWSSRRLNELGRIIGSPISYLEIGTEHGYTFEAVEATTRIGVDPCPKFNCENLPPGVSVHVQTSDEYFAQLRPGENFNLAFLDGLHTYEQTYRDLINTLENMPRRSAVLIDDVVPCDAASALRSQKDCYLERRRNGSDDNRWHGDTFRLMLILRDHYPQLSFRTITSPSGDNEQALVWKNGVDATLPVLDGVKLYEYLDVTYEATFGSGIPAFFQPATEEDSLREFAASSRGQLP
jgi:hypothetical protein